MAVGFDPIPRKELYLDVITGGDSELPEPLTREEIYLAKIAGMAVDIPEPLTRYEQYLYAIANGDTLTLNPIPRLEMYLAKACGQDIDVPEPITREEKYWFDYISGGRWETLEYTGAVPVTIYAAGEPLIDLIISGNMNQSGTPTPTTPIQPSECGERTGNSFDEDNAEFGKWVNSNGSIVTNATYAAGYDIKVGTASVFTVKYYGNKPYSYSMAFYDSNGDFLSRVHWANPSASYNTFSVPENAVSARFQIAVNTSVVMTRETLKAMKLMLNAGSTALPYEPFGYKIPISSASTTTPIYLGEVETTRRIKKLVLTGEETYTRDESYQRFITSFPDAKIEGLRITQVFCTHFISVHDGRPVSEVPNNSIYSSDVSVNRFFIKTTDYTTDADFKAYLAQQYANGTPVCVWYVLATETTGIVNEPLRKIGNYADSLSLPEGVSIPTIEGENLIDVETTLKPSEIYLKYKGRSS